MAQQKTDREIRAMQQAEKTRQREELIQRKVQEAEAFCEKNGIDVKGNTKQQILSAIRRNIKYKRDASDELLKKATPLEILKDDFLKPTTIYTEITRLFPDESLPLNFEGEDETPAEPVKEDTNKAPAPEKEAEVNKAPDMTAQEDAAKTEAVPEQVTPPAETEKPEAKMEPAKEEIKTVKAEQPKEKKVKAAKPSDAANSFFAAMGITPNAPKQDDKARLARIAELEQLLKKQPRTFHVNKLIDAQISAISDFYKTNNSEDPKRGDLDLRFRGDILQFAVLILLQQLSESGSECINYVAKETAGVLEEHTKLTEELKNLKK